MEWIELTSDNTPDFDVPVLVYGEKKISLAALKSKTISKNYISFEFSEHTTGGVGMLYLTPTHWMPLPEPPKQ